MNNAKQGAVDIVVEGKSFNWQIRLEKHGVTLRGAVGGYGRKYDAEKAASRAASIFGIRLHGEQL